MSYYDTWGRPSKGRDSKQLYEKAFHRKGLPAWDEKWHQLSPEARLAFVDQVKGPVEPPSYGAQPNVPAEGFAADVLEELTRAGFIEVRLQKTKIKGGNRVFAVPGAYDFAVRVRALRKYHLLVPEPPAELQKFIDYTFYSGGMYAVTADVLRKAGVGDSLGFDDGTNSYILNYRWPSWVAEAENNPLAERLIAALREADGPLPIVELTRKVSPADPEKARTALETLIVRLAVLEDLDPTTHDIVVGFHPKVRAGMIKAAEPRERPPLVVSETPREIGPQGNMVVHDIRAMLLEIASEPPRLRGDRAFYAKEVTRFLEAVDPLPDWLVQALKWTVDDRIELAHAWARYLKLVKETGVGNNVHLGLSARGEKWLASPLEDQYASVLDILRTIPERNEQYNPEARFLYDKVDYFSSYGLNDAHFLAIDAKVFKLKKKDKDKRPSSYHYRETKVEDLQELRQALDRAFGEMEPGRCYQMESFAKHTVFGAHNPLRLGLGIDEVLILMGGKPVPPLEELVELAGLMLLNEFLKERLIPLGCLTTALDDSGQICMARTPQLDAFFGRAVDKAELVGATASGETRVVVQPDFSVVIIGLNPAPAAALAPFCERSNRGGGQGAMVLKLTRTSVVKAVANGLEPKEIIARLKKYASVDVPANVLKEVEGWAGWVRRVTTSTMTVLRCPDRETADRVLGALKRQGERVNDTLVAIDIKKLTSTERTKLRDQGILVDGGSEDAVRPKAKKRRQYY
jgi:Helicase conserved C-terminal domain